MKPLPETEDTLFIRTDFSNADIWAKVCEKSRTPDPLVRQALELSHQINRQIGGKQLPPMGDLQTPLHVMDDREYDNATLDQITNAVSPASCSLHGFLFIVDKMSIDHPDNPILVVDLLKAHKGRTFRTIPTQVFSIQSNLSIANMDWEEFAENVDEDGIFRDFH